MPSRPHPLRRISTNSLTSLARSQQDPGAHSPSGLGFLAPALQDLVDESASLVQNTRNLNRLDEALGVFAEGFGAYMYALRMGAFCVDWREGPEQGSWARGECGECDATTGTKRSEGRGGGRSGRRTDFRSSERARKSPHRAQGEYPRAPRARRISSAPKGTRDSVTCRTSARSSGLRGTRPS